MDSASRRSRCVSDIASSLREVAGDGIGMLLNAGERRRREGTGLTLVPQRPPHYVILRYLLQYIDFYNYILEVDDLSNTRGDGLPEHVVCRREILRGQSQGFIHGELVLRKPAGHGAGRHFADLPQDVLGRDGALPQRPQVLAAFNERSNCGNRRRSVSAGPPACRSRRPSRRSSRPRSRARPGRATRPRVSARAPW